MTATQQINIRAFLADGNYVELRLDASPEANDHIKKALYDLAVKERLQLPEVRTDTWVAVQVETKTKESK